MSISPQSPATILTYDGCFERDGVRTPLTPAQLAGLYDLARLRPTDLADGVRAFAQENRLLDADGGITAAWGDVVITGTGVPQEQRVLAGFLGRLAAADPDHLILLVEDVEAPDAAPVEIRAADMAELVSQVAGRLVASGVRRGRYVMVDAEPTLEAMLVLWAGFEIGAGVALMRPEQTQNPALRRDAMARLDPVVIFSRTRGEADPDKLVRLPGLDGSGADGFEDWLDGDVAPIPEAPVFSDPAVVMFSSGSTGMPKAMSLPQEAVFSVPAVMNAYYGSHTGTRAMAGADLSALGGLRVFALVPVMNAATGVIPAPATRRSTLAYFTAVQRHRVDLPYCLPANLRALHDLPAHLLAPMDFSLIDRIHCGTGVLHPQVVEKAEALIGAKIYDNYGCNELGGALLHVPPGASGTMVAEGGVPVDMLVQIRASDGRPVGPGETGVLWAYGERMMSGYLGDTPLVREDGWYRTGDSALRLANGRIRILGRESDLIKTDEGAFLSPMEVEDALMAYQGIAEAVVLPVIGELGRETLFAFVETDLADNEELFNALSAHVAGRLGNFARPSGIRAATTLPRIGNGKPDRAALRDMMTEGMQ